MLDSFRKGYAVMSPDLSGISFDDESLEVCKQYCYRDSVIVERIPYKCGITISFIWRSYYKPFQFRYNEKNIFWIHWQIDYRFLHKTGKIVFKNPTK